MIWIEDPLKWIHLREQTEKDEDHCIQAYDVPVHRNLRKEGCKIHTNI